jgi:hypothetical protein
MAIQRWTFNPSFCGENMGISGYHGNPGPWEINNNNITIAFVMGD